VEIFNLKGWRLKEAWVGARIGAELIGGSMSELEPGDRLGPYHTHHANEEWLLVIRGTPTLRAPEGELDLKEGDVVCLLRDKDGAHQVSNRTACFRRSSCAGSLESDRHHSRRDRRRALRANQPAGRFGRSLRGVP
jgi:uncharacterized cupin superfamily protein